MSGRVDPEFFDDRVGARGPSPYHRDLHREKPDIEGCMACEIGMWRTHLADTDTELRAERAAREQAEAERDEALDACAAYQQAVEAGDPLAVAVEAAEREKRNSEEYARCATQNKREGDLALASGAMLVHAAREALTTLREGCPTAEKSARALYGDGWRNGVIDAAFKVLDGGGDVRGWLDTLACRAHEDGALCARCNAEGRPGPPPSVALEAALASAPALPDATEALAAFAASLIEACAKVAEHHAVMFPMGAGAKGEVRMALGSYADAIRALDPADLVKRWMEDER